LLVWLVPTLLALTSALVLDGTQLDRDLLRPFYDQETHSFPLQHSWFFAVFLHTIGTWVALLVGFVAVLVGIAGWFVRSLRPWRWSLIYVVACTVLTSGIVDGLRLLTNRYPPWAVDLFGGKVPYTSLLEGTPAPFQHGHAFPAAYASGMLAWVSLWFVARSWRVPRPAVWLFPVISGGLLFAWTQHVRGANFPSHNLWTLGIAWSVAVALAAVFSRVRVLPQAVDARPPQVSEPALAVPVRSWLIGIGGMFAGCLLFAIDTAVEQIRFGPRELHFWIECVEFTLIGPGLGLTCLLLAERLRTVRAQARVQAQAERERRFLVLGRMAAAVAHEVRNPLHTLRLVMDELRVEQPALRDHSLRPHIDDSLERIDRAVDLVYRLARPESDEDGAGDLVVCVREAEAALRMRLPDCQVELCELPEHAPVRCAASGLRIMIDNLLRNAAEATAGGGMIAVRIDAVLSGWRLRISNPGVLTAGVPREGEVPVASSKASGLGLGLAITRHLADGVGGQVTLSAGDGIVTAELLLPAWKDTLT
jgi:membrane-associated PAP2 superfamily phosphatase